MADAAPNLSGLWVTGRLSGGGGMPGVHGGGGYIEVLALPHLLVLPLHIPLVSYARPASDTT